MTAQFVSRTFRTLGHASLNVRYAFAEFLLRIAQILVGVRKVLHFFVELFFHLRQLL